MPNWTVLRSKLGPASMRHSLLSAGIVVSLTASGLLLPGMLLNPGLQGYVSEASVKVSNPRANAPGIQRLAVHLQETLLSPMTLGLMVSEMKLQPQDLTGTQAPGYLSIIMDLLAGGGQDVTTLAGATETALKKAVRISAAPSSDEIDIDVTAATPDASQRIADYLAIRVVREIGAERHDPQLQAVETARVALDSAEASLTGFQMRHGNDSVSRIQGLQQNIREEEATTATLNARDRELGDALSSATSMKLDDVLSRTLPAMAEFMPLEAIRQSYTTAKLALAEISVDHGPKHPRTIAAQTTLDAARATAMPALRRVREALAQEKTTVKAALDAHASVRADLDSQLQAMGDAPADLARLEAALEKARSNYIISSQAAGTFSPAPRISAAVSDAAQPGVANYDSFTATAMALAGGAAGLLMALLILSFKRRQDSEEEAETIVAFEPDVVAIADEIEVEAAPVAVIEPGIFEDLAPSKGEVEHERLVLVEDVGETMENELPAFDTGHEEPANDMPLDQRVRQVLMRNAVPATPTESAAPVFKLPPLLAAALAGKAEHPQAETAELRALRQELVVLRERLHELAQEERDRGHA
ncbi:hypothetical protein [Agrobacterium vaccinii]|uniref:hypothetical protein n=1 Tax=Agrobacterium vaccinii TaxID=2735528 RepID=UPI001E3DADD9|nr:hypothetical protein [Agrobacterium vaccinii]UHS55686.1 hypothetical protein HRS00_02060 [Agrobacterium vaccinii]